VKGSKHFQWQKEERMTSPALACSKNVISHCLLWPKGGKRQSEEALGKKNQLPYYSLTVRNEPL
jgi:hypothetical protein